MAKPTPKLPDHVGRVHAQWRRELPDIDLAGSRILARARRITLMSRARIEAVFAGHGLDTGEFDVLASLRRAGAPFAMRPTELFRTLMVSSGGLTDRLRRLETRGFVRRRPSGNDRRSIMVELTTKGRSVIEAAFREDMEVENELVAKLSAPQREKLAHLLEKLATVMEESAATSPDGAGEAL